MLTKLFRWLLLVWMIGAGAGCSERDERLRLGGGPSGGSFQRVAEELAAIQNEAASGTILSVRPSSGSEANLIKLAKGELELALVYSGDAMLAQEAGQPTVTALARIYGGAAQLVVLNWSSIRSPYDLRGKRVAIGNPRSGTALAAKRYLSSLGIWPDIIPIHVGFANAMQELTRGDVEAVWLVSGCPNSDLYELSRKTAIRHVDLLVAAQGSGFFHTYPFYAEMTIPAGTYDGQVQPVRTFQDAVLLVAQAGVDAAFVHYLLGLIFQEGHVVTMHARLPETADMAYDRGLEGIAIPLHPGAERFWRESP